MKKFTLGIFACAALMFSACSTDVKDSTTTVAYASANLITPLDGSDTYASAGTYSFFFNLTQNKVSVYTDNLMINNTASKFSTDTVTCDNRVVSVDDGGVGQVITINNAKGYLDNSTSYPITNSSFMLTSLAYRYNGNYPGINFTYPQGVMIVGQYRIENLCDVKTFYPDASFYGSTTSSYVDNDGNTQSYTNKDMLYRVVMDLKKNTASVVIYEAKFAEPQPKLTGIILRDLKVTYHNGGYSITGSNIVPEVIEGVSTTPNEKYVFDTFSLMTTSADLVDASINFQVAGKYKAFFTGSYIVRVKL